MKAMLRTCVHIVISSFILFTVISCNNDTHRKVIKEEEANNCLPKAVDESSNTGEDREVKANNEDIQIHVNKLDPRENPKFAEAMEYLISHPSKYTLECLINSLSEENDRFGSDFVKINIIIQILHNSGLTKMPWKKSPKTKKEWLEKYHSIRDNLNLKEK